MTVKPRVRIVLIGAVWCILSALCFLRWQAPVKGAILGGLGALLLLSGLFIPTLARAIHGALDAVTGALMTAPTWLFLGLSYYLFITPVGLLLRLTGSLQTTRGARKSKESYWTERPRTPMDISRYLRPF